jgi:hypothetical protein
MLLATGFWLTSPNSAFVYKTQIDESSERLVSSLRKPQGQPQKPCPPLTQAHTENFTYLTENLLPQPHYFFGKVGKGVRNRYPLMGVPLGNSSDQETPLL